MVEKTRRSPRPDDLYRLLIPTDPRLSPDGANVVFTVQRTAPTYDGYRTALWLAASDGSIPAHRLTIGSKHDSHPRWSPDGRMLAFLSDRRTTVEEEPTAPKEREDAMQVHVLPFDHAGEARRLTDLPRGVDTFEWSPDGTRLAILSSSRAHERSADTKARRRLDEAKPGTPPASDYRFFDRLGYQLNGPGFIHTRKPQVWIVDVATGAARLLTGFANGVDEVAWSPDGKRLAITTAQRRDADLSFIRRILVLDPESGAQTAIAERPDGIYFSPTWLPSGDRIAVLGGTRPNVYFRTQVLLFAADGSEARTSGRDLTGADDVMAAPAMGSDLTPGENSRAIPIEGGRSLLFNAAHDGSMQLWRVPVDGGRAERLTDGEHYLSGYDAVAVGARTRVATIESSPMQVSRVVLGDLARGGTRL